MLGVAIVLLSACFFCVQNVIVRVLFNQQVVLGIGVTGGFVPPTLENSFLLLVMRMVLVVPLMAGLAAGFYPATWKDIRQLGSSHQRRPLLQAIAGGGLMFLYLALLYVAIGLLPAGIALTLFFSYPVFTALFSWGVFGTRPSRYRWVIMGLILLGSYLTMPAASGGDSQSWLGVLFGLAAGVAYALYTVNAQKSFDVVHPFPFTWISFATTLALSTLSLSLGRGNVSQVPAAAWGPLWIGGLLSALVTFAGHVLNNLGIRGIGATAAAMIGASNPALTVVLAWVAIQEAITPVQLSGVILVTASVAMLAREHRPRGRES
ncbi:putative transporter [Halomicronema hongdechloris C2206]|uniref:Transporter n=1 Tax=Halomicronema hongdechloris C2206 TaxID=1641165 RepID=A0A1Z3HNU1_9CYAN|nr:DMT family transporter [Halomicronema hongdechloris]ASC71940.1 putative transporter [Halomicronema hongdechloris C2206]